MAARDSLQVSTDESSTLSANPKLGIYLACTGFGFMLIPALAPVGVLLLWVGLAVPFRGSLVARWGVALVVALLIGWAAVAIRPWASASRPPGAPAATVPGVAH